MPNRVYARFLCNCPKKRLENILVELFDKRACMIMFDSGEIVLLQL